MPIKNAAVVKRSTNEVVRLLEKYPYLNIQITPNRNEFDVDVFDVEVNIHDLKINFILTIN